MLSERHNKFAVTLHKYYNGGSTPDDCAATLEEMFADITKVCANIERVTGSEIWQAQTYAHMTQSYRQGKGYGKGKGNEKGKGKGKGKAKGKGKNIGKGKNKGKSNGKGKGKSDWNGKETELTRSHNKTYNRCQAKDCWGDAKQHKFCSECFMKGMNTGHIMCYDGYNQPISRASRQQDKDKTSTYGFSNKQMEGIAAVAAHIAQRQEQNQQLNINNITPFKRAAENDEDNQANKRKNIFERLGDDTIDKKKQQQEAFFSRLSQYQQ